MFNDLWKPVLVILLVFGMLFFQKQINRFFNYFWREEKLKRFLLNPITATISSVYLMVYIYKSDLIWNFLIDSDSLLLFVYISLITVPLYSFRDFYIRIKNKKMHPKEQILEGGAYLGVKIILLLDVITTIIFLYNEVFK